MAKKPPLDDPKATEKAPVLSAQQRLELALKGDSLKGYAKKHPAPVGASSGFSSVSPRIPTEIVTLDLALRGGIPTGVVHHWHGPKASGKTTGALITIARAQKLCSICYRPIATPGGCCDNPRAFLAAYQDVEGILDFAWAETLGVDRKSLLYSRPETAEQTADQMEALLLSGEVDLVVTDSLAMMIPQSELGKAAEDFDVGTQAKIIHRMARKITSILNTMANKHGRRPTPILLNQNRMKVGVMFGNPETTSGGMGPGYVAGVEIRWGTAKHEKDKGDDKGDPLSVTLSPRIEKSKLFPGKGHEAEFTLLQKDTLEQKKGEVVDSAVLVDLGVKAGLIEGNAPSVTLFGETYRGKSAIEVELTKNRVLAATLRDGILKVLLKD